MFNLPLTDANSTALHLALMAAISAEQKPATIPAVKRPAVPDDAGQQLDTDYDPDPAQEPTPMKNDNPSAKPHKPKPKQH